MQMKPDYMAESDRAAFKLLLAIWQEFMRGGDHSTGFNTRDPIMQSDGAADFEQLCSRADYATFQAVDGCIDSLPPHERSAIYATNGQAKVMRFPRLDPSKTLIEAELNLLAKLRRNICTAIKFMK